VNAIGGRIGQRHLSERLRAVRGGVSDREVPVGIASSAANTPWPTCARTIRFSTSELMEDLERIGNLVDGRREQSGAMTSALPVQ